VSAQATATRRTTHPAHHQLHHPVVRRIAPHQWTWSCPCGGGLHGCSHTVPDQHSAFVAANVHLLTNPGA